MAQKLIGGIPGDFDLPANFIIQVTAVDPSSGATVSGVKASNVVIVAAPITPDTTDDSGFKAVGPFLYVPGPGA